MKKKEININQQLKDELEQNAELLNKTKTETLEAAISQQYKQLMFQKLCEHEPKLKALHAEILSVKDEGESFCADGTWHGYNTGEGFMGESFKKSMSDLVGWSREDHPVLGTLEAEYVAFEVLCRDSLPACRECRCVLLGEELSPGWLDAHRDANRKRQERIKQEVENG